MANEQARPDESADGPSPGGGANPPDDDTTLAGYGGEREPAGHPGEDDGAAGRRQRDRAGTIEPGAGDPDERADHNT